MPSAADFTLLNERLTDCLLSDGMQKDALDPVHDYTRTTVREDGFFRRLMPMVGVTNDDLDRDISDERMRIIVDRQPNSPAAVTVPFNTGPKSVYIRAQRYPVYFSRILSRRFQADVDMLRTYKMDVRQILSDQAAKDIHTEEDRAWLDAVDTVLGGSAGSTILGGTDVLWQEIESSITRESLVDMLKIMPATDSHLMAVKALTNHITALETLKFGRDEIGGNFSEELFKSGNFNFDMLGLEFIVSIKRDLVPDNTYYLQADPKFVGKSYSVEDLVMSVENKDWMIKFFLYELIGAGIGHIKGLARVDFV